jgi:hypothetical protein
VVAQCCSTWEPEPPGWGTLNTQWLCHYYVIDDVFVSPVCCQVASHNESCRNRMHTVVFTFLESYTLWLCCGEKSGTVCQLIQYDSADKTLALGSILSPFYRLLHIARTFCFGSERATQAQSVLVAAAQFSQQ